MNIKKVGLGILVVAMVLGVSGADVAGKLIPIADQAKEKTKAENSSIIEKAWDDLVLTPPGLEKVVFIHYKKGFAKPGTECGNDVCEQGENAKKCPIDCGSNNGDEESVCYAFMGAVWKDLPVDYVIDWDNPGGLTQEFVVSAMSLGAEEWDDHVGAELFGSYTIDNSSSWDSDAPDGRNELLFGNYEQEGVIGVTVIWGYFRGKPSNRKIVEFDILFDTDFTWGDGVSNLAVMDLQNIATHELGHGVGLADLYDTTCVEETMYGYSDYGEIKKRDLNAGDITGIQELYGGL